jgi:hypothetical protein
MKYLIVSLFLLAFSLEVFSKDQVEKTFLVLFNKSELKKTQSSTEYIELNFFDKFQTKSYSGNSEAALLITIPDGEMNECQMGETLIQVNHSTWIPLKEIAFRIIDLKESKENYQSILSMQEDETSQKKRKKSISLKL